MSYTQFVFISSKLNELFSSSFPFTPYQIYWDTWNRNIKSESEIQLAERKLSQVN